MGDERPDARPDVLLTGLLFYDLVLTGLGKPPTPGEEIWTDGMGTSPGGIANLAVAAARYGLRTSLATVFGDDYYGAHCREVLAEQEHIDLSLSRTADGWHTPVTVSIAYGHDRALVTHGQEPPYSQDALMGDPPAARTALVHIEAEPREWLAKAAANGTKIFADVGWDPTQQWSSALLDQLALCHAFVPNDTEAMAYTRTDTAADALSKLSELVPVAVVTRGGDGAIAVDQTTGEYADVPALATEVLDATGAGDVFGASFVAASLEGWPLEERLRFAVLAAGLSVRRHGGALAAPGWYGVHQWWRSVRNTEHAENSETTELRRAYGFLADRMPADPGPPVPHAPVTPPAPHGIPDLPDAKTEHIRKAVGAVRLSRRGLLRAGLAGTAATALGGLASGCAVPTGSTGRNMVLWYWSGGLSDTVVKKAKARYDSSVDLDAIQIGGYYRSKLITTMTGQAHIPDIAGLKGEDMASYLPNADQFVDLRTLGAEKLKSQYLDWKWQQAVAPDGSLIGFPIDVGPVVQYYQPAVYEKAGLAYEPDDVSSEMNTWDKFFAAGEQLKKRIPGTYILTDVGSVFEMSIGQGTTRFVNRDKHFIGDGEHVRVCWDRAVEAKRRGIVSDLVTGTPDSISATEKGRLPSQLNASWAAGDLKLQYPKTKGRWRVANCPGGPSNVGGSFLAITKACREPEKAFEIITWLLNADNQAQGFVDAGLFPSTPASYDMKKLREPDPFFGDQITMDVYGPAAEKIPVAFNSPFDVALGQPIRDEIKNVGVLGKDPKKAWRDAMSKCRRIADHLGVSH